MTKFWELTHDSSETRYCTMLIGAIQIVWSVLPITGGDWRFISILRYFDQGDEWLFFMLLTGLLLLVGGAFPLRKLRHIGLFLSSSVWLASFGMWLNYWAVTNKWLVSPTILLFPLLGMYCLILLGNDILGKPKTKGG